MSDCQDCKRKGTNETGCPNRMSDGRHFTNYNTRCAQNQLLLRENMPSSFEYRMFLTKQADQLMQENRMKAFQENACYPCYAFEQAGTMLPEKQKQKCNDKSCSFNGADAQGLGLGRDYGKAPSKDAYYPIGGLAPSPYDNFGAAL